MTSYYNAFHVFKKFKTEAFIKLSTKNLRLKCQKLASCWIGLFRVIEWIGDQAYRLLLSNKYAKLYLVFPVQLLEDYHCCQNDAELVMSMPDLEDSQDEWEVEEVQDKQQIKNIVHYLVKWAGWSSKYSSYKSSSHLANILKVITDYEYLQKCKCKRIETQKW